MSHIITVVVSALSHVPAHRLQIDCCRMNRALITICQAASSFPVSDAPPSPNEHLEAPLPVFSLD